MNSLMTRGTRFDDLFKDLMSPGFFIRPLHGDPLPQSIKVDVKEDAEAKPEPKRKAEYERTGTPVPEAATLN